MKNLRTIFSSVLVLLVLASSVSRTISLHFCGGEIQSMAVFISAQQCEQHNRACDHSNKSNFATISHKGCCEDATLSIETDKYQVSEIITFEWLQFLDLPEVNIAQDVLFKKSQSSFFSRYKPPLIERDITVLIQTFLI